MLTFKDKEKAMINEFDKWDTSHRPWPVPSMPWVMRQSWNNALFLHYPIALKKLRELVPQQLPLDSFDGWGWISIVPFKMENVGLRAIPFSLAFPELNVRTYVTIDNKPGVYFFSLDATHLPVVWLSQKFINLPYLHSQMSISHEGDFTRFTCVRKNVDESFECTYHAVSEPFHAAKDSIDYWLTEKYCFYTVNAAGKINRCNIHHKPWPIQRAEVNILHNSLFTAKSLPIEPVSPLLHYTKGVDVRVWPLERVSI